MNCTRIGLCYYSTASASTSHFTRRILHLKNASGPTKVDDALQLFDEMLQRQPPPNIIQFNQLITLVVKMKHYSTALSLFKQMRLMGVPSDLYTMTISINCHCRLNQVTYGFALLATIFKQGHPPSLATYTTLIHGLVLADRVFEAVELFKKLLRDKLCEPNQVMYGTVINGLCKVGHTNKALELLTFMESGSCKPCVRAFLKVRAFLLHVSCLFTELAADTA
ncbi:putative tetratricopeptide-like helical domain superfamily [Helianthus anomalus]